MITGQIRASNGVKFDQISMIENSISFTLEEPQYFLCIERISAGVQHKKYFIKN